ncbi:hypothetical protein ACFU6K_15720 [Kitasatospora sp. NPDC057512]|uniref:hypothetical protein n=1 Tax=Kitasatospora sp. NPDC057512 TaxID=3346154 RepID=UPI0036C80E39
MREQPSRTEPPDAVPEFRPDAGPGPSGPRRARLGSRAPVTPRTPPAPHIPRSRDRREKWPRWAVRVTLGYGTAGGSGEPGVGRDRPLDTRGRTPAAPARRAGAAIEMTEDRA